MPETKKTKIVVMGGGTGTYTVLMGLKLIKNLELTAIVSMVDDGGSTGQLRDELGILPPGDIRQCLVALSKAPEILRKLFNYRFEDGSLAGHAFGNIFISALEKTVGGFNPAMHVIHKILKIYGRVIPVTLDNTHLIAEFKNKEIIYGQNKIAQYNTTKNNFITKIYLNKKAHANLEALQAIKEADFIVIGPGNFYCSIIPVILIEGIKEAIKKSKATKIFIINLVNKIAHSLDSSIFDFTNKLEFYLGKDIIDYAIFNNKKPAAQLLKSYKSEGSYTKYPVKNNFIKNNIHFIGAPLCSNSIFVQSDHDKLNKIKRSFIRHDSEKLAEVIWKIVKL